MKKIVVLGSGLVGGPDGPRPRPGQGFQGHRRRYQTPRPWPGWKKSGGITTVQEDLRTPGPSGESSRSMTWSSAPSPASWAFGRSRPSSRPGRPSSTSPSSPRTLRAGRARPGRSGVTAVVDCGVAPGMSNLLVGYAVRKLDETASILIYVGGLPEVREWPYEYKAVFSPADVIEEYVRPARYIENGAAGHPAGPVRPRTPRISRRRDARGLQHRRPADPGQDDRRPRT